MNAANRRVAHADRLTALSDRPHQSRALNIVLQKWGRLLEEPDHRHREELVQVTSPRGGEFRQRP